MDLSEEDLEYLRKNPDTLSLLRTGQARLVGFAPKPLCWSTDDEGNFHVTIRSNGLTPEQWVQHGKLRGWQMVYGDEEVLFSAVELPTNNVTRHIVIRPGYRIHERDRAWRWICYHAQQKGWIKTHWEVGCLIRDTFTDHNLRQMGLLNIITMHESIKSPKDGSSCLVGSSRSGDGSWFHCSYSSRFFGQGTRDTGFAFEIPQ